MRSIRSASIALSYSKSALSGSITNAASNAVNALTLSPASRHNVDSVCASVSRSIGVDGVSARKWPIADSNR